jgi:glycosyltransferase involved in cell wall biosynthesis
MTTKTSFFRYLSLSLLIIIPCLLIWKTHETYKPDITVIGPIQRADGLGRNTLEFIELIDSYADWNFIKSSKLITNDILNKKIKKQIVSKNRHLGKVILVTEPIYQNDNYRDQFFQKIHNKISINVSKYKHESLMIALSMFESNKLPIEWVNRINSYFDAIIVPDDFLISVYQNSGVMIPIFVCPLALNLKKYNQNLTYEKINHDCFVFGFMGSATPRKNVLELIECFQETFSDNPRVKLKINCRYADPLYLEKIQDLLAKTNSNNIMFSCTSLNEKGYFNFMSQLDCLINVSAGEGYSIQPREALSIGIPCILSMNTAQSKFKNNPYVIGINCNKEIPSEFMGIKNTSGSWFSFEKEELKKALLEMYENYNTYTGSKSDMFKTVEQYDFANIAMRYKQIAKPRFKMGKTNSINDNYIETDCRILFEKAKKLRLVD